MLLLVLLLSVVLQLQGAPTGPTKLHGLWPESLQIAVFDERHNRDIIRSCCATILGCTWISLHPDVPGLTDSGASRFMRHVTTVLWALVAPELMAIRAMRERFAARAIAMKYNEQIAKKSQKEITLYERFERTIREWFRGPGMPTALSDDELRPWTTTHGFFLLMGGFMLCESGQPVETLTSFDSGPYGLKNLIEQGVINAPKTTESDIKDRSKSNTFSKGVVAIQTLWFVARCLRRWWSSLPVTVLEVLTLCFVLLNVTTMFLLLDKPQRVGVPIFLDISKTKSMNAKVASIKLTESEFLSEKSAGL